MYKLVERITVDIKHDEDLGLLYATSPNIRGLLVADSTPEKCWTKVPQAIADLRATNLSYEVPTLININTFRIADSSMSEPFDFRGTVSVCPTCKKDWGKAPGDTSLWPRYSRPYAIFHPRWWCAWCRGHGPHWFDGPKEVPNG